ncbi:MAG: UDP-N-acetylmuramate--L-alanine ligase [Clostridiales Family XIII bacterium]|jgi:UDP-N-acetylmuramate--alanine ligase|nr:UDP-N-acetylmuramate--L-alanine ligase [Clostridiales Family XIII bacterium]
MLHLSNVERVHCIGIGGIGLSALAEILIEEGYIVSGSDMQESDVTARLIEKGAQIFLGHRARNINAADLVVYSSAVHATNPELVAATSNNIPTITRAQLLGELMARHKYSIAVSGAHGKTTATSMISLVLNDNKMDPTILVGGNLSEISGNVRIGKSEYFITEACEYMDSFLSLSPYYAIILNIDSDHLDYFGDIDHIIRSFHEFSRRVPKAGAVVAFDANPFVSNILRDLDRRIITYGYNDRNDYSARDIEFNREGRPAFSVIHGGKELCRIQLGVPGEHNVNNALAAFSCCHDLGVAPEQIKKTLEAYSGTQRRFDMIGETRDGICIIDDYAHHPAEILVTIEAARKMPHGNLWVIFQPHTYTRTMALHDEFADALETADKVVLTEIYGAREKNVHQISSKSIASLIKKNNPGKEAYYFKDFDDIASFVLNNAERGDLIITMGAGDIYKVGKAILESDRLAAL